MTVEKGGPVTVWIDYGSEGWRPSEFPDEAKALEFIRGGTCSPFRLTRELTLGAWVPAEGVR